MRERRRDARKQVEDQKLEVAEAVFDLVAEDPQNSILPKRWSQPPCMNIAEKMVTALAPGWAEKREGTKAQLVMNWSPPASSARKNQHVEADKSKSDGGKGTSLRVVVADWEHAGLRLLKDRAARIIAKPIAKSIGQPVSRDARGRLLGNGPQENGPRARN